MKTILTESWLNLLLGKIIKTIFFFILVWVKEAGAYNKSLCEDFTRLKRGGTWQALIFDGSAKSISSTTQFISSWGPCSAIGRNLREEREEYFKVNESVLKKQISQASGSILNGYFKLTNCERSKEDEFYAFLKGKYDHIFYDDSNSEMRLNTLVEQFCSDEID